jgi:RimJ/RimL family protein N-acetyltransferase
MDGETLKSAPRELLSPRLRLLAPQVDLAQALLEGIQASFHTLGFVNFGQAPWSLERAQRHLREGLAMVERGEYLVYYAFRQDNGAYVGRIDLHSFDFDVPRAEVGYVGDVRQAGQGLMREAVLAVLGLGFELGLQRIQALSEAPNQRALQFAEAVGFTREGVLRHYERDAQGQLGEQVMFAMLPGDWAAAMVASQPLQPQR